MLSLILKYFVFPFVISSITYNRHLKGPYIVRFKYKCMAVAVVLGGMVVRVLAIGPKVRGSKPGRRRWSFKGEKIRTTPNF
jgi:hypothetical protein